MIDLDNSATTKPFNEVTDAMVSCLTQAYYNPSALYAPAMLAARCLKSARETVAQALGGGVKVTFTSGGTEADNLAILGAFRALRGRGGHLITTQVEHPAVLEAVKEAERQGCAVTYVGVNEEGVVDVNALVDAVREDTFLVSVMQVNNEVGAVMPIEQISQRVKAKKSDVLLHVDGVQGFLRQQMSMRRMGVDLYTLSGHKIHGPKGVGALAVSPSVRLMPIVFGGGQEDGLRSGTENMPGIVGLEAAVRTFQSLGDVAGRLLQLKTRLRQGVLEAVPDARVNGPEPGAPHILNLSFPVKGEVLLHALEGKGILVSTGSACSSHKRAASPVLTAMGLSRSRMEGAIRFSLSPLNTMEEMEQTIFAAAGLCAALRPFQRRN